MIALRKAVWGSTPDQGLVQGCIILVDPMHIILMEPTQSGTTFITMSNPNTKPIGVLESVNDVQRLTRKDRRTQNDHHPTTTP